MKKPETALDKFRIREAAINADVAEDEKHYDRVILEQEKIASAAKVEREKAAAVLAKMIADFEKIEGELEGEELKRIDAQNLTKAALDEGRIGATEYFKHGLTAKEITGKVQAAASEKLADLKTAIRAKALRVLELEVAELEAEYNIAFARTAPASALREKLAALLKDLEKSLASPFGLGGEPDVKAKRDAKLIALKNAQGLRLTGDGWRDYDLAGLKQLRLDPTWPAERLGELDRIIAEAKMTGRACRLLLDPRDRENPVNVMWG